MKFAVINDKGKPVMYCNSILCIPDNPQIISMSKAGYKFKIDGKIVSQKKLKELKSNKDSLGGYINEAD